MYLLPSNRIVFPPINMANSEGLLAIGGDLSIKRLVLAYQNGIFPWYDATDDILWWAPPQRMILFPDEIKISKTMRRLMKKNSYTITENKAFERIIELCATSNRRNKEEAWLHADMIEAYTQLHREGLASSIEVWNNQNELVGGLYGVHIKPNVFSGESMFHLESNTSKLAYIYLAQTAKNKGYEIIDCQMYTDHLASLGAREIPRDRFMEFLK